MKEREMGTKMGAVTEGRGGGEVDMRKKTHKVLWTLSGKRGRLGLREYKANQESTGSVAAK